MLAKLLIPAGYMPASLGDGGPLRLCHVGLPVSLQAPHLEHMHHGSDGGQPEWLYEHCSLGALAAAAAVPASWSFDLSFDRPTLEPVRPAPFACAGCLAAFRARAPPRYEPPINI